MNNKVLKILLAASLALNLAFIYVFVIKKAISPKERYSFQTAVENELNLTESQKSELAKIAQAFRIQFLHFKEDILQKRIEIVEELSDPEADLTRAVPKIDQLSELENQLNHRYVEVLFQINSILDSQQRLNFIYRLSRNWFFLKRPDRGEKND